MGRFLALALAGVCALPATTGAASPAEETIVYTGATLIDGTGAPPRTGMAIVTRGERIAAVVPAAHAPKFAKQLDMSGTYVLPGLINTHVHMATWPNLPFAEALLRRDVYNGVTAVRDMAGDARELAYLSRAARLGEVPAPDIYYAALMAAPEFFKDKRPHDAAQGAVPGDVPWLQAITDKTDITIAVARARGTYATGIKIYADLPAPLVDRITAEAHAQGILVWDHAAVFPASPKQVIDSGADVVSHVCMLAYQASQTMPRAYHNRAAVEEAKFAGDATTPVMQELFADMKRRGTILDATLYVYDEMSKVPHADPPPYCTLALAEKLAHQAHRAGVEISTGTDGWADWKSPYPALPDELGFLVHGAGFSPLEAIRAATLTAARTIGHEEDMGTIARGKLANLVFLAKDPLADIANVKSVVLTVKRGHGYTRKAYKPITKDEAKGDL